MKTMIAAVAATLMFIGTAFAQHHPEMGRPMRDRQYTPEQIAQRRTDELGQKMTLTEQQRTQVYKLFYDQAAQMQKQREEAREARMRRQEALDAQRTRCENEMKSILTPEQYTQWLQLRNEQCPGCDGTGKVPVNRPRRR